MLLLVAGACCSVSITTGLGFLLLHPGKPRGIAYPTSRASKPKVDVPAAFVNVDTLPADAGSGGGGDPFARPTIKVLFRLDAVSKHSFDPNNVDLQAATRTFMLSVASRLNNALDTLYVTSLAASTVPEGRKYDFKGNGVSSSTTRYFTGEVVVPDRGGAARLVSFAELVAARQSLVPLG